MKNLFLILIALIGPNFLFAQELKMDFEEYEPTSTLKVPEHIITKAKFPFIDIHNHQGNMPSQDSRKVVEEMDKLNMAYMVNLSGRGFSRFTDSRGETQFGIKGPDYLVASIKASQEQTNGRIIQFTNIDFSGIDQPEWTTIAVKQLEEDVKAGARGLKIYKNLGLEFHFKDGRRLQCNDPIMDPIWEKCGELGIPILIHTGEPAPFFDPHDRFNERWLELKQFPSRARPPEKFPTWEQVMSEHFDMIRKHPNTTFISAHFAWMGNDLTRLGNMLDTYPNMVTEFGAIVAELGRQPQFARAFFIKYQDRILFGKDTWAPEEYHTYFRLLETNDEYFKYFRKRHAFWRMYGLNLPDDVLKKIYYTNAAKILKIE
ncbi:MAG: hypothetical protein RIR51_1536 [Bacteroidota bacterium]